MAFRICALALLVTLLTAPALRAQEVGLQLYSLRNELAADVHAGLDSIAGWGIRYVEGGNNPSYGLGVDSFKTLLDAHELDMVSVPGTYEQLRDSVDVVAARAHELGADYVVCFWIPHADTVLTEAEATEALAVFNDAGRRLAQDSLQLLYHPHGYEFGPHADGTILDYLVRGSTDFDFELDIHWIGLPGQDIVAWMRRYAGEWRLMHLKDCQRGVPPTLPHAADVEWNVVLGEGQWDMPAILAEARKQGIPYLFVEDESSKVMRQARPSIEYVREQLARE